MGNSPSKNAASGHTSLTQLSDALSEESGGDESSGCSGGLRNQSYEKSSKNLRPSKTPGVESSASLKVSSNHQYQQQHQPGSMSPRINIPAGSRHKGSMASAVSLNNGGSPITPSSSLSTPSSTGSAVLSSSSTSSIDIMEPPMTTPKGGAPSASTSPTNRRNNRAWHINDYIHRLINSKGQREFCLSTAEIRAICRVASTVFLSQPVLLELGTPVKVVGDIHGQFEDLLRVFQKCGMPPKSNYLFLGDYVDRGKRSLETIMLLMCLKIKYPENVFLLRGNHECASVTKVYGFYDECKRRCNVKIWKTIVDVFNTLPIAATIGGQIFCVHGGLSPSLKSMRDITDIQRPTDVPDTGLISDLLWSDPDQSVHSWSENDRGVSYCFGKSIVDKFCKRHGFSLIARGHMVVEDGYEFFDNRKLVTVFSAPNYCGEFQNRGAVMSVSKDLLCSFDILEPIDTPTKGRRVAA